MMLRSILRFCSAGLLLGSLSTGALAFENIPGTGIAIENLTSSYQSVSVHSSVGREQTYHGQPNKHSVTLMAYSNRTLVGWQPMPSPSCQTGEGYTSVQLIYSRKGSHSGKFTCDPLVRGGSTEQSVSRVNGSYTTKAAVKGDVVSLTGQITYTSVYKSQGQGVSRDYEKTDVTRVSQKLQIRITEAGCEVLEYEENAVTDERGKGLTDNGVRFTTKGTNWRTSEVTPETRCKFF